MAHLNYDAQLRFKQNQIQNCLKQHVDVEVSETLGMENPTGYRNKAQIPTRELRGELTTGFFRRGSHNLMPIEDFYIQDPEIDKAIVVIRDISCVSTTFLLITNLNTLVLSVTSWFVAVTTATK